MALSVSPSDKVSRLPECSRMHSEDDGYASSNVTPRRWLFVRVWIAVGIPTVMALVAFGGYQAGGTPGAIFGACIGFVGGATGAWLALQTISR